MTEIMTPVKSKIKRKRDVKQKGKTMVLNRVKIVKDEVLKKKQKSNLRRNKKKK